MPPLRARRCIAVTALGGSPSQGSGKGLPARKPIGGEWLSKAMGQKAKDSDIVSKTGTLDIGRWGICTKEGRGKGRQVGGPVNQDATCVEILGPGLTCFGVFDGHGEAGGLVSNYVATKLPNKIREVEAQLRAAGQDSKKAQKPLETCFMQTHTEMCNDEQGFASFISGSTGLVVCLVDDDAGAKNMIVGNAGDCRAVLAAKGWGGKLLATQLSIDQDPCRVDERRRIEGNGGVVGMMNDTVDPPVLASPEQQAKLKVDLGPARIFFPDGTFEPPFHKFFPGLAMARSFGDSCLDELGCEPIPEVSIHTVRPKDQFFMIASDGVWQVLSNDEVVSCIAGKEADVGAACEATVRLAAEKWDKQGSYRDDITCLIVTFDQNTA